MATHIPADMVLTDFGFRRLEDCGSKLEHHVWAAGHYHSVRETWVCEDVAYEAGKFSCTNDFLSDEPASVLLFAAQTPGVAPHVAAPDAPAAPFRVPVSCLDVSEDILSDIEDPMILTANPDPLVVGGGVVKLAEAGAPSGGGGNGGGGTGGAPMPFFPTSYIPPTTFGATGSGTFIAAVPIGGSGVSLVLALFAVAAVRAWQRICRDTAGYASCPPALAA